MTVPLGGTRVQQEIRASRSAKRSLLNKIQAISDKGRVSVWVPKRERF